MCLARNLTEVSMSFWSIIHGKQFLWILPFLNTLACPPLPGTTFYLFILSHIACISPTTLTAVLDITELLRLRSRFLPPPLKAEVIPVAAICILVFTRGGLSWIKVPEIRL